ncbi:GIY-YIG nuclease family protein [Providencia rettgeri]
MNSSSYVYILVYPHLQAIKIGKANNVFNRVQRLCRWGNFDSDKSFKVKINQNNAYKLESSIHFLLRKFKKEMVFGDGFTEFFEIGCYSKIIELMNLFEFKIEKISVNENKANKESLSGSALKLRKFENKVTRYSDSLKVSATNILGLKRAIRIMKKRGYSMICYNRSNDFFISVFSEVFNSSCIVRGVFELGAISSLTGEVRTSFIMPNFSDSKCVMIIDVNHFKSFVCSAINIGRIDYIHVLLFCYDFLKRNLPNESELPTIKINKENRLEIF